MNAFGPAWTRDCLDPWIYVEIRVSGGIAPCCVRPEIANLADGTLAEALNGPAIRRLRANLLTGRIDRLCINCKQRAQVTPEALRRKVGDMLARVPPPRDASIDPLGGTHPDATAESLDALAHALQVARAPEAALPAAAPNRVSFPFSDAAYLEANPDLAVRQVAPRQYFLSRGAFEKRRLRLRASALPESDEGPPMYFDPELYLRANADVERAGADPAAHYLRHGRFEMRRLKEANPVTY